MIQPFQHHQLLEFLHYSPDSGYFTWRVRRGRMAYPGAKAGTLSSCGYYQIGLLGSRNMLHRLAWFYVYGEMPEHEIDHINGNRSDNRISNLRAATRNENNHNCTVRKDSTTGVKGVSVHRGRYIARVRVNGKRCHIGCFGTIDEAALAVQKARLELHGDFSRDI